MSMVMLSSLRPSSHGLLSASSLPSLDCCVREPEERTSDDMGECGDNANKPQSLLDSMLLVEPWKHPPVPNHILETKIFAKHSENDLVCAMPAYIQFAGFQPGKVLCRKLQLLNKSGDVQRFHIIPPQTKHFGIKYTKDRRLVPGLAVSCVVEFYPDENRYFYDCIRLHCQGDDNLIIPIHAFPVLDLSEFPKTIDFPVVPIGQSKSKSFRLRSIAPVCFNYQLTCVEGGQAFNIQPMCGTVPANEEVTVHVTFSPTAFITATMYIRLDVSQFKDFDPLYCSITGRSYPGLTAQKELANIKPVSSRHPAEERLLADGSVEEDQHGSTLDPECVTPLGRVTSKKTRHGTHGQVQRQGRMTSKIFKQGSSTVQPVMTRQMKESQFEAMLRDEQTRERQNQIRWQTKLGADPVTSDFCAKVLRERNSNQWMTEMSEGELEMAAQVRCGRTTRDASQIVECCPTFDIYENNMWIRRQRALDKFRRAVSKVIMRSRMYSRLRMIRGYLLTNAVTQSPVEMCSDHIQDSSPRESQPFCMSAGRITERPFPLEPAPSGSEVKDALTLGLVPTLPYEIRLQEHIRYFPLKVCPQYKLLGYKRHSVQEACHSYVQRGLARKLKTGAEDELISVALDSVTVHPGLDVPQRHGDGLVQTAEIREDTEGQSEVISLAPPSGLYEPIRYHPLHIFNPVPGLQTYQTPLPYSEVDPDYHLCPLPRFPALSIFDQFHKSTQKQFLSRNEVIRGVMSWKKFPSPIISATANTPSLVNIWVPQWSDAFSTDILPTDVPALQCSLSEEDRYVIESSEANGRSCTVLTPQMIRDEMKAMSNEILQSNQITGPPRKAENFDDKHLPASNIPYGPNGQIQRETKEQHLATYLQNKRHVLRQKLEERVEEMFSRKD